MKYCILIIDGASGLPLREYDSKTCLELAKTPNLDVLTREGELGLTRTIPERMEPSSACACMSILGYDPQVYYRGRAAIEARSMGVPVNQGEVVFRCNLVAVREGRMWSYSSGYISTREAQQLIATLNDSLGSDYVHFYPGVSYRHLCKLVGREDTLLAKCTPPHDIPDRPVVDFLPHGKGSEFLRHIMAESEGILRSHPVNIKRAECGDIPATTIWLFWGSGQLPELPSFQQLYGIKAAMTSGVDLLEGLARMAGMKVLKISGVTDNLDNDYTAQVLGALEALLTHELVVIHIEAPDEAAHDGSVANKISAIEEVDKEVVSRLHYWKHDSLKLLIMPDHPTPIEIKTHSSDPVPFLLWGEGIEANGANRFTEAEARRTRLFLDPGYNIIKRFIAQTQGLK